MVWLNTRGCQDGEAAQATRFYAMGAFGTCAKKHMGLKMGLSEKCTFTRTNPMFSRSLAPSNPHVVKIPTNTLW